MTEAQSTQRKTVAFLTSAEGIERVELTDPWKAVTDAGHDALLVSPEAGEVGLVDHLDPSGTQTVDRTVSEMSVDDIDVIVLPGGVANPDNLRTDSGAVELVRGAMAAGKPVAAICHAGWVLAEADVVKGRRVTGYQSIRTDMINAGATWEDSELVEDDGLITSRNPDDLPAFCKAIVDALSD